jgi:hypothetical protein
MSRRPVWRFIDGSIVELDVPEPADPARERRRDRWWRRVCEKLLAILPKPEVPRG